MALPGPSMYQKRSAARRRTSDITRLTEQYQRNVQAMTGEYEQAFAQFQAQTAEKMAPYEQAVAKYGEATTEYEKQAAAYTGRLQSFEERAKAFNEASKNYYSVLRDASGRPVTVQTFGDIYTTELFDPNSVSNNRYVPVYSPVPVNAFVGEERKQGSVPYWWARQGGDLKFVQTGSTFDPSTSRTRARGYLLQAYDGGFQDKPVLGSLANPGKFTETFTETPPTAPEAPVAPELPTFDSSQFEARRGQLETELQRELGERRGARRRAVSRGGARPLLQGATA